MSSENRLFVHQQDNVAFDDLVLLNKALSDTEFGELLDFDLPPPPAFTGFLAVESGRVVITSKGEDARFTAYGDNALVWSCFGFFPAQVIAKHLMSGKLVLRFEQEEDDTEFYVITPGHVSVIPMRDIRF